MYSLKTWIILYSMLMETKSQAPDAVDFSHNKNKYSISNKVFIFTMRKIYNLRCLWKHRIVFKIFLTFTYQKNITQNGICPLSPFPSLSLSLTMLLLVLDQLIYLSLQNPNSSELMAYPSEQILLEYSWSWPRA